MVDADTPAVPIGAVTQLTGISSHTLRKWESRYAAVVPVRTESGRRLYTQQQVRKLVRLRDLIRQGHQIGQLSALSEVELEALAEERPTASTLAQAGIDQILVIGEVLSMVLQPELAGCAVIFIAEAGDSWLAEPEIPVVGGTQALVVELPTVTKAALGSLARLRRDSFERVIVVYGVASRKTLSQLAESGIDCTKGPVSAEELLRNLQMDRSSESTRQAVQWHTIPARRFSAQVIASLAALSPKLQCECPNHIAQLVLDISAFEQYSQECEQADPQERVLHARLHTIAAHARALFEQAMAEVAAHEGIELKELPPARTVSG